MATNWIVSNVSGTNEWFNPGNPTAQTPPTSVGSGQYVQIDSGATATGFNGYGATVYISGGGTLAGDTLNGGTVFDSAGGVISAGLLTSGASVFASGGTFVGAITVNSNAVLSGGTIVNGSISGNYGGTVLNVLVVSNGTMVISYGGLESGGTVSNGAALFVFQGGTTSGDTISAGGIEVAQYATINGITIDSGGGLNASLLTVVSNATLETDGQMNLHVGATAYDTIVSGGILNADFRGSSFNASYDVVESGATILGGTEFVFSTASAYGDTIGPAGTLVANGAAYVSAPTISGGSLIISSGATVSGPVTFATSGYLALTSVTAGSAALGGDAISGFASAGDTIDLTGLTASAGAAMTETAGGSAVLTDGANTYTFDLPGVSSGAVFSLGTDAAGSLDITGYGSPNANWIVSNVSGTNEWFHPGNPTAQTPPTSVGSGIYVQVDTGATASGFTDSGATVYVSSGATLAGENLSGGTVYDSAGGLVSGGTVLSGATLLASGGTVDNTVVSALGTVEVSSGGTASGVVLQSGGVGSGGSLLVYSGGTAINFTVFSTGVISVFDSGIADGGTVSYGGGIFADSGATVSGTTEDNRGFIKISAGGTASNVTLSGGTLVFLSSGGVTGVLSGALTFGSGTSNNLAILDQTLTPGTTEFGGAVISGFGSGGDILEFNIISSPGATMSETAPGIAVLTDGGSQYTFDIAGVPQGATFELGTYNVYPNGPTNPPQENVWVSGWMPCFLTGTRIATPFGEVAVEELHEDDLVLTVSGGAQPVRWIGYRYVVADELRDAHLYAPIVIERNAIAEGKPARDLWVTPDHAILVEGRLVPAKLLVNGATIRQVPLAEYSFYHIELDQHALVLAEGLEAESYLDVPGNRQRFANNAVTGMNLDLSLTEQTELVYAERGIMPLSLREDAVKPVWEALAARCPGGVGGAADAAQAAPAAQAARTRNPALHLLVDGVAVQPSLIEDGRYLFNVPAEAGCVTVSSRVASICESKPWIDDRRLLGVAIASAMLIEAHGLVPLDLAGAAAVAGWHGLEADAATGRTWRWTDGAATLALPASTGTRWLVLTVQGTLDYPVEAAAPIAA